MLGCCDGHDEDGEEVFRPTLRGMQSVWLFAGLSLVSLQEHTQSVYYSWTIFVQVYSGFIDLALASSCISSKWHPNSTLRNPPMIEHQSFARSLEWQRHISTQDALEYQYMSCRIHRFAVHSFVQLVAGVDVRNHRGVALTPTNLHHPKLLWPRKWRDRPVLPPPKTVHRKRRQA